MLPGCMSMSYKPSVSLGEAPHTIKAKVKIDKFTDISPAGDKEKAFGGTSATAPGTLAGDLETEVTDAVLSDFNNNQVFDTVKKRMDDPDLVLKGTINRFYGTAGPNAAFWLTLPIDPIWFFGIPVNSDQGKVDLTLEVFRNDRTRLGTYSGKCEFGDNYSMYNNPIWGLQSRLNKCFSDAVMQIRTALAGDESKLTPATNTK